MKNERKFVVRVTAFLMLTALAIIPIVQVGAISDWSWIPDTYPYECIDGSTREISICSAPTDLVVTTVPVPYAHQQKFDMVFGTNVSNVVSITVPQSSYSSQEFYVKPMPLGMFLWVQIHSVGDGVGQLGLVSGALQNVDISINVTGDGGGSYTTDVVRSGGSAPAGSAIVEMPLNLSVWFSTQNSINDRFLYLFDMDFSMNITTGFTEVRVIDTIPFPPGNATIDNYYKNSTGVPFDPQTGTVSFAGAGAGLDIYYRLYISYPTQYLDLYTDFIFADIEVLEQAPVVGGILIPIDKLALLAPYIALASVIILAVAATAIFKYRKKP